MGRLIVLKSSSKLMLITCLHYAAYYGHSDCLETILFAARTSHVAAFLVGFSRFVNIRDGKGETPLHLAARQRRPQCVHILLDSGALGSTSTPKKTSTDPIRKIIVAMGFIVTISIQITKKPNPHCGQRLRVDGKLKKILGMLNILNLISTQTQHFPPLARTHLLIVRLVFRRLSLHNHHGCDRHIIPTICYRLRHNKVQWVEVVNLPRHL
ncbi:putative ankyrin repeat-containing domain-containing protein [Helianthus annuus]|nr:putative ankyrin repeat-containing domain-containing protein [Helianthus annuus]